jgi:hypothetical protein
MQARVGALFCGRIDQFRYATGRYRTVVAPVGTMRDLAPTLLQQPTPQFVAKTRLYRHAQIPKGDMGTNRGLGAATGRGAFRSKTKEGANPIA